MTKSDKKPDKPSGGSGRVLALSVVWALGLLIAFLSYRGEDVGQLSHLAGGLGGGSYFGGSGLLHSLLGATIALLILLAWFGPGRTIANALGILTSEGSRWLTFAGATAIGAAAWSLVWFLLGLVGAYRKPTAVVALVIGLGLAAWHLKSLRMKSEPDAEATRSTLAEKVLWALALVPLLLALIASLAPPTAKDALLYHMAVPKVFVAQGSNAVIEGNIASYLPLGTEMHTVWAMLLGNIINPRVAEAAAGATVFLFFPLLVLAIYGWARELGLGRRWALTAVFIVAAVPTAYHIASNSYIDVALALYLTLGIYALGHWWKTLDRRWAIAMAIFLGAALSIKLTALFVFVAVALMVLLRARQGKEDESANVGRIFAAGAMALILGGLLASPWYLRTWKVTGSPIFPFYMSIWPGTAPGWDVERSHLFQLVNTQYGGANKGALEYLTSPFSLSVLAQPEKAEFFDGVIGAAFLFGLPILIWAWWKFELPVEVKAGSGIALVMFLFWLFSSQQIRYLLPIFPVLAIGICAAAATIAGNNRRLRHVWQGSLAVLSFAGLLTGLAWFLQKNPARVVLGGESRDAYLARIIDYYPYYQIVNTQTPADAKVWLINMRRDSYNIERPYFSDYLFEDWTIRRLVWESRDVHELRGKVRAMGINYILARHDVLLDPARSVIVDDQKAAAENDAKLKMTRDLLFDGANTIRSDARFSLVKIP
jgi:hypothetical protein